MVSANVNEVKKAIKGDKVAFENLIITRKDDIYRICFMYAKDNFYALDIMSESIYRAFLGINKLKSPEFFNTWITKVTINASINFLIKQKRISSNEIKLWDAEDINEMPDNEEDLTDNIANNIDLMREVDKLEIKYKTVIILRFMNDFSIKEIADILNCPIGTVKTRLNKAIKILRQNITN